MPPRESRAYDLFAANLTSQGKSGPAARLRITDVLIFQILDCGWIFFILEIHIYDEELPHVRREISPLFTIGEYFPIDTSISSPIEFSPKSKVRLMFSLLEGLHAIHFERSREARILV